MRQYAVSLTATTTLIAVILAGNPHLFSAKGSLNTAILFGYLFGFGLCALSWTASFKRQMNAKRVRNLAFFLSSGFGFITLFGTEIVLNSSIEQRSFDWFNVLIGSIGIGLGIWSFRLLYRECY